MENRLIIYPFKIPCGYTGLQILEICDNSRVEHAGRPCKDRVKAKKKPMSTACITVSSEGVRSWGFMDYHFGRRLVPRQRNCPLRDTLATVLALWGKEVGNGKRELHTCELGL